MDRESSVQFIGSLTKFLHSLCNGYVQFQKGMELVGHIYLSTDTGEKIDYILHENVNRNENSVTFISNSFHAQPQDKDNTKKAHAKSDVERGNERSYNSDDVDDDNNDDNNDNMLLELEPVSRSDSGSDSLKVSKRKLSPRQPYRHGQQQRTFAGPYPAVKIRKSSLLSYRNRQRDGTAKPSTTVTSQQKENLDTGETGLEEISGDELLEDISGDELFSLAPEMDNGGTDHEGNPTPMMLQHETNMQMRLPFAPEENMCEFCGKQFSQRQSLYRHNREVHGTGERFTCVICQKDFARQCEMKRHQERDERERRRLRSKALRRSAYNKMYWRRLQGDPHLYAQRLATMRERSRLHRQRANFYNK